MENPCNWKSDQEPDTLGSETPSKTVFEVSTAHKASSPVPTGPGKLNTLSTRDPSEASLDHQRGSSWAQREGTFAALGQFPYISLLSSETETNGRRHKRA